MMSRIPDLWSEDAFEFDSHPHRFVMLHRDPIVWTTRGIRYFSPRFQQIGIRINQIVTRQQFAAARARWDRLERELLTAKILQSSPNFSKAQLPSRCLQAIIGDDPDVMRLIELCERVRGLR